MAEGQKRSGCLKWGAIAIGGLFALGVIGAALGDPAKDRAPAADGLQSVVEAPADPPINDPGISADEFAQLTPGMSYEEAIAIIGSPGEVISESAIAGTVTRMHQWKGESGFGPNANAMFQDGKLVSKAQFGLE